MAPAKTRRNDNQPTADPAGQPVRDAIVVHSDDGGQSFGFVIPPDCQISPFAWPTVLRRVADRLEEQLKTSG